MRSKASATDRDAGQVTDGHGPSTTGEHRRASTGQRANSQRVVILSGLSGAGKTAATKLFEDLGYMCMDNLPGELLPELAELVSRDRQRFEKVAIVLDVRAGDAPLALAAVRGALEGRGIKPRVFFLDARDDVLIRRYSETRHRHPLAGQRGIAGSIAEERRLLEPVRADSDVVIDTSDLSLRQLKERIFSRLADPNASQQMVFQLISFGFKYGIPLEADLVFDVRFMVNPFYVDELRHLSGLTAEVRAYVMAQPLAPQFLDFLARFLELTVPGFEIEGKTRLTIAVGCTGGYHRSIVIVEELRAWLERRDYGTVSVFHRELEAKLAEQP
ncbi:MAG TPA: RNase adapter RapZ [Candidatus Limnocylindrales bacterium]